MSRYQAYPKYKDSGVEWLGEVPEHWEYKPIKRVASCNDEVLGESTSPEFELEYVEISDVSHQNGIENSSIIVFSEAPSRARRKVKDGDVIVSTVRTYLRAISPVRKPPENMIVSTGFAVIRPHDVAPSYLGYVFLTEYLISKIIAHSTGVSYPAINSSELIAQKITIPSKIEQTAIANFLDTQTAKIDILIAKQQRMIALLGEKRQALISHAVTKGLNPDAPMKDSGVEWLGEVPVHWAVSSLAYYAQVSTGSTPDRTKSHYWNGDIPWVKTGEVRYDEIFETEEYITSEALENSSAKISPAGTLLMAMYGQGITRGRVALLGVPATYNQACAAITLNDAVWNQYLRYFFMAAYHAIRDGGNETSQMNLNADLVGKFKIVVPDLKTQQSIVCFLDGKLAKLDSLLSKAESAITLLQERRSALISAAVTGKIDVRELA